MKHKGIIENVTVLNGATSSTGTIDLNPGNSYFNEWLSKLAILFE